MNYGVFAPQPVMFPSFPEAGPRFGSNGMGLAHLGMNQRPLYGEDFPRLQPVAPSFHNGAAGVTGPAPIPSTAFGFGALSCNRAAANAGAPFQVGHTAQYAFPCASDDRKGDVIVHTSSKRSRDSEPSSSAHKRHRTAENRIDDDDDKHEFCDGDFPMDDHAALMCTAASRKRALASVECDAPADSSKRSRTDQIDIIDVDEVLRAQACDRSMSPPTYAGRRIFAEGIPTHVGLKRMKAFAPVEPTGTALSDDADGALVPASQLPFPMYQQPGAMTLSVTSLLNDTTVAFCLVDLEGNLICENELYRRLHKPSSQMLLQSVTKSVQPDRAIANCLVRKLVTGQEAAVDFVDTVKNEKTGNGLQLQGRAWLIKDQKQSPKYVMCVSRPQIDSASMQQASSVSQQTSTQQVDIEEITDTEDTTMSDS